MAQADIALPPPDAGAEPAAQPPRASPAAAPRSFESAAASPDAPTAVTRKPSGVLFSAMSTIRDGARRKAARAGEAR